MQKKTLIAAALLMVIYTVFAQSEGSQTSMYTEKQQQLRITAENVKLV